MVLVVDDNKTIADNIIDELDLDDVPAEAVHTVDEFMVKLESSDFLNYTHIIMDYNLEDRLTGVELMELIYERYQNFQNTIYFFSGNISYISKYEREFITQNEITAICKTEAERLIEIIIDEFQP